ncbi:MAG: RNA 2',3'-cyclic phosphodiesterase [Patescibacteria group bacterium]|jgi:2'-5' RNA ligase
MKKRLFVAINFDPATRLAIARLMSCLPNQPGLIKTKVDNLHLTLLFLGDTDEELIPQLARELEDITKNYGSLSLKFGSLGGFPDLKRPQTIWIGIDGDGLGQLQRSIAERLLSIVRPVDTKPFLPHLTIARANGSRPPSQIGQIAIDLPPVAISQVDLMESILAPGGSVYKRISAHRL